MKEGLIFELVYQIVSLESNVELEKICEEIFKEAEAYLEKAYSLLEAGKKEEGKREFYVGDTFLISLDQILGERLGPIMLRVNLKKAGVANDLDFITKIDKGGEVAPELLDLANFYKTIKKWKQKCWEPGKKVLEIKKNIR